MTAANFDAWWAFNMLPEHDGRENDTPPGSNDPPTRWGFTYPTWVCAMRRAGHRIADMTMFLGASQNTMRLLALGYFWGRHRADDMAAGNDVSVIDWAWTSGGAIQEIQRELGFFAYDVDGAIGPKTLEKIERCTAFPEAIHRWRKRYYDDLGFRDRYPGLYARADSCLELALRLRSIA